MDTLLSNLSPTGKLTGMNTEDILAKIINIMGSRVTLQGGFREERYETGSIRYGKVSRDQRARARNDDCLVIAVHCHCKS